ncbi:hypothetical protein C1878_07685 [Gordonibacter sp. 28C]|uniref:hypothetical protein n=1 Tax=Gordonibacter sp. 28C TaxID=2078569 RepID=UPI000DF7C4EF|nr:hypothetical protein [Gordonibacter sp. 28C]RDB62211.1 hypothetical protein C1878_07685 [Gordonibacter sp. 28C]
MTDTMKKLAAGAFAALALCLALAPGIAWADVDPEAVLQKVDGSDDVSVAIVLPDGARDQVNALQLAITLKGDSLDEVKAEFAFDDSLKGVAVKEARYRHEGGEGRLNLYLAGNVDLFATSPLKLGAVHVTAPDGTTVQVGAGQLSVVNAAHDASTPELYFSEPVSVEVGAGVSPNPPTPPAGDDDADKGDGSGTGSGTGDGSGSGGDSGYDGSANRSPGAPSGTDSPLVTTGDNLATTLVACGMAAVAAGALVVLARRKSRR